MGNARQSESSGAFSATVQLLTATATANYPTRPLHGACVYAINYPPVGRYTAANQIKFNGTPPFYLTYSGGGVATVTQDEAQSPYSTADKTLASFTDASLAPGVTKCKTPAQQTLNASAAGYCEDAAGVTLSLSGTENGAVYELYNIATSAGGATLTGTGGAVTFSGHYTAGSYAVRVVETAAFCPLAMNGTHTVTENPLPTIPATEPANQSACSGVTVALAVTAQQNTTYTWYKVGSATNLAVGASYTTNTSGSYYTVATSEWGCTQTSRIATVSLSGTGGGKLAVPTTCGCAAGLSVSPGCSYCVPTRPASTVNVTNIAGITAVSNTFYHSFCSCPSGWRTPTFNEYKALYKDYQGQLNLPNENFLTSDHSSCGLSGNNCNATCTSYRLWLISHTGQCVSADCGAIKDTNGGAGDAFCTKSKWLMLCVR